MPLIVDPSKPYTGPIIDLMGGGAPPLMPFINDPSKPYEGPVIKLMADGASAASPVTGKSHVMADTKGSRETWKWLASGSQGPSDSKRAMCHERDHRKATGIGAPPKSRRIH